MKREPDRVALIDFAAGVPTPHVSYTGRLPLGNVTLSRCVFQPNPGVMLGSKQTIVAVHSDPSFELEWWDPGRDLLQRTAIKTGDMSVICADLPVFHRWTVPAKALIIALDTSFVERTFVDAFDRDAEHLPVIVGVADPTVQHLAALCNQEIVEGGAAGRLYTESLATALVVHLFRSYGVSQHKAPRVVGGLAPLQLRRVMDHIEERIDQDLGLADLAAIADLSSHHFGQAFKASMGIPPHRYLIERRIHRAKELLIGGDRSIAEIAVSVGFSSQSHMTFNFRKLVATTPARYRRAMTIRAISDEGEKG
jgi:AraC family transcriptional regulator